MVEKQRIEREQILRDEQLALELYFKILQEPQLEAPNCSSQELQFEVPSLASQKPHIKCVTSTPKVEDHASLPFVTDLSCAKQEPQLKVPSLASRKPQFEIPRFTYLKPQSKRVTSTPKKSKVPEDLPAVDSMLKDFNADSPLDISSGSDTAMEWPRSSEGSASAASNRFYSSQLLRSRNATPFTHAHGKGNSSSLRSTSAESHDSITSEMYHFKPITAAPKTPPKRQPDGRLVEPAVVQTKARKLDYSVKDSFSEVLCKKVNSVLDETNSGACGGSETSTAGNSSIESPFVTHSSIYVTGISKPKNVSRKTQGIDTSFKENYPLYPGVDTSIRPHGSKTAVSTRMPRALAKRSQNQMDESDSLCSSVEDAETSSILEESDYQKLEQENADREFALRLQNELNKTVVQKRIISEYNLRSCSRKKGRNCCAEANNQ